MLRKILLGFVVLLLLLVGVVFFLYHKLQPGIRAAEARAEARTKMLQPRLVTGTEAFEKRSFYVGNGLGNISEILAGWPADREGADIAVIGSQGADFVDSSGQFRKRVRFSEEQRRPISIARIDSTGNYGYLTRDESWAVPATLFDREGNVSWRSDRWPGVDDSAPGNVNGDMKLSVAVGFNGNGGLVLFDGQGKQVWKKAESNVWHVETLDTDGDGHDKIVHSNAKGQLLVRNASGEVTARYLPDFYVSHFALTRWGKEAKAAHILVPVSEVRGGCCKPTFIILDAHGQKVTELDSPMGDLFNRFSATPIRFADGAEYFAVLENSYSKRSMLLLYREDGQIAYQEILGESCLGIAAIPNKHVERLLIGCAAQVWEYSPRHRSNGASKKQQLNAAER